MKRFILPFLLVCASAATAAQGKIEFGKIKEPYLLLPVSNAQPRKTMVLSSPGMEDYSFVIRLAPDAVSADYWVFCETAPYKGRRLTVTYPRQKGLELLYESPTVPGADSLYTERLRPQQHFTFKVGWNNDANGMIYHDGEYHLFAQHNPYETAWQNMHWGHAVSTDMVHWKQLPVALRPDSLGTMYSGSAVMDWNNTAGFNKKGKPAMIAVYTTNSLDLKHQRQCLAYSLDNGRTWTKYKGNPVLDSGPVVHMTGTRDPKVFWYEPGGHWVMVLFEGDGHTVYTSGNLKDWTYASHIDGFYECPDLYELPVDGNPDNRKWVLTAASGVYMVGQFDGRTFTPESGVHIYGEGSFYAGQTFSEMPDGRVVQIVFENTSYPGMPFKSSFSTPLEMSLRTTPEGVRLFAQPVKEFENIQHLQFKAEGLDGKGLEAALEEHAPGDSFRVRCTISVPLTNAKVVLTHHGQDIVRWDVGRCQINGHFHAPVEFCRRELTFDLIADRGIVEAYFDDGAYVQFIARKPVTDAGKGFSVSNNIRVESVEIYSLDSIWNEQ